MILVVWAADLIPIATVVADPRGYHLKEVMFRGTVRGITTLPPYRQGDDGLCWGSYTFKLEDETSSIEVFVRGVCGFFGDPGRRPPQAEDGERIALYASIFAGYYTEEGVYRSNSKVTALSRGFQRCPPC